MAPPLTAAMAQALRDRRPLALLAEIQHPSGSGNFWTGVGTLLYGGPLPTWDPSVTPAGITLSNNNHTATNAAGTFLVQRANPSATAGKLYMECQYVTSAADAGIGICNSSQVLNGSVSLSQGLNGVAFFIDGSIWRNSTQTPIGTGAGAPGDMMSMAVDLGAKRMWFRRNAGSWFGSASVGDPNTPATGYDWSAVAAGPYFPACEPRISSMTCNFGDSAYTQSVPLNYSSWSAGGKIYTGVGQFGTVTPVRKSADLSIQEINFSLIGVDTTILSQLADNVRNLTGKIWLIALDEYGEVVSDPYQIIDSILDYQELQISDDGTAGINIIGHSGFYTLERALDLAWTSEDQAIDFPTDVGLDMIPVVNNQEIQWTQA